MTFTSSRVNLGQDVSGVVVRADALSYLGVPDVQQERPTQYLCAVLFLSSLVSGAPSVFFVRGSFLQALQPCSAHARHHEHVDEIRTQRTGGFS